MDGGAPYHQQGAGGLAEVGKYVATGGGRQLVVGPVLQGGDSGGLSIRVGVLGDVRRDDAGDGGIPRGVFKALRQTDGTWETTASEDVLRTTGKKSVTEYIGCRQATVANWVALCPLLEVCARETDYKGGRGRKKISWRRQQTTEEKMWNTLEEAARGGTTGKAGGGRISSSGKGVKGRATEDRLETGDVQVDG